MEQEDLREQAIKRIKSKREIRMHIIVYLVINAMFTAIWALSGGGYFWPAWVLVGWGVGLVLHIASFFVEGRPIHESAIEREMRHLGGSAGASA